MNTKNIEETRDKVREGYSQIAKAGSWNAVKNAETASSCCGGGGCCGPATFSPDALAEAIGYSMEEVTNVPDGSNMGLSCGNPTAIANLKDGDVVIDLGSGGGFDCFIAGPKVGARGRVIGVDMTPDMISKARKNIAFYNERSKLNNVEFRLGEIEHLPVADSSVDVVISNCVINLSPEKQQAWNEMARVLKDGGRIAISDLALLKPLPGKIINDVEALVGCVAGASLVTDIEAMLKNAGFSEISLTSKPEYIDAMMNWEDPLYKDLMACLPTGSKMSDFVVSLDIAAKK
jgi:arsenite methyltransferase